jgi:predicted dinucleotide-binding enzyme
LENPYVRTEYISAVIDYQRSLFIVDDEGAKKTAAHLIRDVGFNPVDLGSLSAARYLKPFSLLVAQLALQWLGRPAISLSLRAISEVGN